MSRPRHTIAFLLDSAPRTWSSAEERQLRFCEAFHERGVRTILVFSEDLPAELRRRFQASGAEVVTISYGAGAYRYYRDLGRLVKQRGVTTAHVSFFDHSSAMFWLARLHGLRHIVYEAQNSGALRAHTWKKQLLRLRARVTTFPITRVIAISEFVKRVQMELGVDESRIVVRYLGIDTRRFSPGPDARQRLVDDFAIEPDALILATVSALRPNKYPQVLVEACGLLARRGLPVRLFVAGDGVLRPRLEALSRQLGIADRTHWLGHLASPERLLQSADIFLLASIDEAFGFVLAEAMACGVPVVATRSGGIVEVVEHGTTGLLAPPLDPEAFADAIEKLAEDDQLRRDMGERGIDRVRRKFTVEALTENTMRIYDSIWNS
jgi:L-malate glycosyltransferase